MSEWLSEQFQIPAGSVRAMVPPLAAVVLVFLLRELVLLFLAPGQIEPERRAVWRRRTLWVAVAAAVIGAVATAWARHAWIVRTMESGADEVARVQGAVGPWVRIAAATLCLLTFLLLIWRTQRRIAAQIEARKLVSDGLKVQRLELLSPQRVQQLLLRLSRVVRLLLIAALLYVYVPFVLAELPQTREFAEAALPILMVPVVAVTRAFVDYLPNLLTLIVIFFVGRFVLALVRRSMEAVGNESITIKGFEPDWAAPTYKLGRVLICALLVMLSYPYLPGSGSEVFKGFSLFFGLLVTLGASAAVSNVIAGIILTYTGAFRVGDRVRLNDTVGDVVEKKLFVTRIRTSLNEDVTVPNSLVNQSQIVNYTASTRKGGLALTVEAGIGYDVDWRVVHKLLLSAAAKTENVLQEREPFVLQSAFGDFAVQYRLVAFTGVAAGAMRTASTLRQHALDEFNAAGIEIMTPMVHAVRNSPELATPSGAAAAGGPAPLSVSWATPAAGQPT